MKTTNLTILEELAKLSKRPVPLDIEQRAANIFRHNFVMALAARKMNIPGHSQQVWPTNIPPQGRATRFKDGRRVPIDIAVFDNSLSMGARAQHDESPHSVSHFGSTVLPALIAAAEIRRSSGREILAAMVAGYEVGDRIGSAMVKEATGRGFRPTGIFGPIASAAAVATLLDFDESRWVSAVAFACNMASGLSETWRAGTDEWKYQTAFAARNGLTAAMLAYSGAVGSSSTIEASRGFQDAYSGSQRRIQVTCDADWAIRRVNLKLYPVCVFNQAPVQQTLAITRNERAAAISLIEVALHPLAADYPGVSIVEPAQTRPARLMSLPFSVATAALRGRVDVGDLEGPDDPDILALASRIKIVRDRSLTTHGSHVTVRWFDGTIKSSERGQLRVQEEELFRSYVALFPFTGLGQQRFQLALEELNRLPSLPSLEPLLEDLFV